MPRIKKNILNKRAVSFVGKSISFFLALSLSFTNRHRHTKQTAAQRDKHTQTQTKTHTHTPSVKDEKYQGLEGNSCDLRIFIIPPFCFTKRNFPPRDKGGIDRHSGPAPPPCPPPAITQSPLHYKRCYATGGSGSIGPLTTRKNSTPNSVCISSLALSGIRRPGSFLRLSRLHSGRGGQRMSKDRYAFAN